jgi:DNA-binding NarL/FixJ family response regulator
MSPPTDGSAPIRVVIADDHHIWRSGLRADLGDGFDVVGEAEDATSAIERIDATTPDLALVDLHMPEGGGSRWCGPEPRRPPS